MNECKRQYSSDKVVIVDGMLITQSQLLALFDDWSKIVIVQSSLQKRVDFLKFVQSAERKTIKVQSYKRSILEDGSVIVKEDEIPPFTMTCGDYWKYYEYCNLFFNDGQLKRKEGKEKDIVIKKDGKIDMVVDIFSTVLYAIDIPLHELSVDLADHFNESFMFSSLFLPGKKYCYFQFVSNLPGVIGILSVMFNTQTNFC